MNNNRLKAFVRFGSDNLIVPSSLILQRYKPTVGKWKEIDINQCCNYSPTTTTSSTLTTTTTSTTLYNCIVGDVMIGTQIWAGCNLNVNTYRNGDIIPQVTDPIEWSSLTTGAWCYYQNSTANGNTYGKLYNWHAVNDSRGLAPVGYHVPTDAEWATLTAFLGGAAITGGKMKEADIAHWATPNTGATNSSGFTGLPGGTRFNNGTFFGINNYGNWWSFTENSASLAWCNYLSYNNSYINRNNQNKSIGCSVRLITD
jgi:uncharacterized protein (TIGR02145 family)